MRFPLQHVTRLAALAIIAASCGTEAAAVPCHNLNRLAVPDAISIRAQNVPAGDFVADDKTVAFAGLPAFCRVTLMLKPRIGIELWLPDPAAWNGDFQGTGTVRFGGYYLWMLLVDGLRHGYAVSQTDGGHAGTSGAFALRPDGDLDWDAIRDFADRSAHAMPAAAKTVIAAYYRRPARHAYFWGCSLGGYQGLKEAEHHPEDYDGILAGSPAVSLDRFMVASLWPRIVINQEVGRPIADGKLILATKAATEACASHEPDRVVSDPRTCHFDPAALLCRPDADPATCLTAPEARAIAMIWDGPRDHAGNRLWYGLERDGALAGAALVGTLAGGEMPTLPIDFETMWLHRDPKFDWTTLSEDALADDLKRAKEIFGAVLGNDDPDLGGLARAGHHLIIWHGWADHLAFPQAVTGYYEAAARELGSEAARTVRLFMAPGTDHCFGGAGPDAFGGMESQPDVPQDRRHHLFAALKDWVETGVAPDSVVATKYLLDEPKNGALGGRRICAYPAPSIPFAAGAEPGSCPPGR